MHKNIQSFAVLLAALCLQLSLNTVAKEPPANLEPLEEFEPPTMSKEEAKPDITVIEKEGETVEEYRMNGQLYMMKVTPKNGKPYYMHKEDKEGGWTMDGPNEPLIIPKWTIFRF